jgi:ribose transport system permease protein
VAKNNKLMLTGKKFTTELLLVVILIILFFFFSIVSPYFLNANNLSNLLRQTSINGIIAMGMVMVIISAGIDLSVGATVGLSVVITAYMVKYGVPMPLVILAILGFGFLVGLVNGILIFDGNMPAFIVTLGTMTIVRYTGLLITNSKMITGIPREFTSIAQFNLFNVLPFMTIIWIFVLAVAFVITKYTIFGRNIYAVGSNMEAAKLSGINVRMTVYGVYVFCGIVCAIAGFILTARLGNGLPTAGNGYELNAILAAVVGGASLSGGEGTVLGAILGAFLMSILRQGGNLLGANSFFMEIIIGVLIIIAVFIDKRRVR